MLNLIIGDFQAIRDNKKIFTNKQGKAIDTSEHHTSVFAVDLAPIITELSWLKYK